MLPLRLTSRTTHDADDDVPDVRAAQPRSQERADAIEGGVCPMLRQVVRGVTPRVAHGVPRGGIRHSARGVRIPIATIGAGSEERDTVTSITFGE